MAVTFLKAQDPAHFKIGTKEFANTNIYTLFYHDETDIIYAGTNNGLFAYKQNKFIKLKSPDNQIGNSIFQLQQNSKGEVFCCNLNGQIFKVEGNSIKLYHQFNSEEVGFYFHFFIEKQDEFVIATQSSIYTLSTDKKIKKIINRNLSRNYLIQNAKQTQKGVYFFSNVDGQQKIFKYQNGKFNLTLDFVSENLYINNFIDIDGKTIFTTNSGHAFSTNKKTVFKNYKTSLRENILALSSGENVGLNAQKGMRYFSFKKDTLTATKTIFKDQFLSTIVKSKKGVMLLGTFGDGVIVVPNNKVTKLSYNDLLLGIATSPTNNIRITTRTGKILKNKEDKLLVSNTATHNVDDIYYLPNHSVVKQFYEDDFFYQTTGNQTNGLKDAKVMNDSNIIMSSSRGLAILGLKRFEKLPDYYIPSGRYTNNYWIIINARCNSVEYNAKDSTIFYSTNYGVHYTKWFSNQSDTLYYKTKQFLANDLFFTDQQLICASDKHGVLVYKNKKVDFKIDINDGLRSNTVLKIVVQNNLYFILTTVGLQVYDIEQNQFLPLGIKDGLITNGIKNIAVSNDKLWLLEKHSCFSINIKDIIQNAKAEKISTLFIDSITVNNKAIQHLQKHQFNYTQNAFDFYVDYRQIESKQETTIKYTLDGFYSDWKTIPTTQNKIEFQSLPSGKYSFKVKAIYYQQESKTFEYKFEITPPFWQSWWFYVLLVLTVAGLIIVISIYRIKRIRKKNKIDIKNKETERKAIDSQLKALRAQMNPHFIFNAINSIQDLILQKKTIKSYDYLVVFSKLVRNTLDFSEREYISIKEELAFLETYLSLEKLRFKDDFNYTITCDIKEEIQLPSLIIQPFIENALKHGLLHQKGHKKLEVKFTISNTITCEIIDNGIGRAASNKINESHHFHKSFSTNAIKQRLEILNLQSKMKTSFISEDLKNSRGEVAGTKVIVELPYTK